jgi:toxin ParE1/3/4
VTSYNIVWRPQARDDLLALYEWIANQADPDTAFEYARQIETHANTLATFPERGTPRDDLASGVRTTPYRRRTVVAYRVLDEEVEILAIAHAGRDLRRVFEVERLWHRSA